MANSKNILFVSHDANRAGAQLFLLSIMRHLKSQGNNIILLVINDWGNLNETFDNEFITYYLNSSIKERTSFLKFTKKNKPSLKSISENHKIDFIYVNTIASVDLLPELKSTFNKPIVTHIHELSYSIAQFGSPNALELLFEYSNKIIACSKAVAENLKGFSGNTDNIEIIHSFVDNESVLKISSESDISKIRNKFGLKEEKTWIGACGNADWRKAPDVFVQIASETLKKTKNFGFVWIGINFKDTLYQQLRYDCKKLGIENDIIWIEPTPEAIEIINTLDIFLVCSREDPFPLVMLEAALCSKPILGFQNTGGADEFIENDCGLRAPYLGINEMVSNILTLNKNQIIEFGDNAKNKILTLYSFEQSFLKIEKLINHL